MLGGDWRCWVGEVCQPHVIKDYTEQLPHVLLDGNTHHFPNMGFATGSRSALLFFFDALQRVSLTECQRYLNLNDTINSDQAMVYCALRDGTNVHFSVDSNQALMQGLNLCSNAAVPAVIELDTLIVHRYGKMECKEDLARAYAPGGDTEAELAPLYRQKNRANQPARADSLNQRAT